MRSLHPSRTLCLIKARRRLTISTRTDSACMCRNSPVTRGSNRRLGIRIASRPLFHVQVRIDWYMVEDRAKLDKYVYFHEPSHRAVYVQLEHLVMPTKTKPSGRTCGCEERDKDKDAHEETAHTIPRAIGFVASANEVMCSTLGNQNSESFMTSESTMSRSGDRRFHVDAVSSTFAAGSHHRHLQAKRRDSPRNS